MRRYISTHIPLFTLLNCFITFLIFRIEINIIKISISPNTMVRYEENLGNHIGIAYGHTQSIGIFLSVFDDRLKFHPSSDSEEINKVTEQIGPGDGEGGYFDLHTGPGGYGQRVTKETICVYLARYGVPGERIKELMELPVWTNADAEAHFTRMGMKYSAATEQFIDLGPLAGCAGNSRAEKKGMYCAYTMAKKKLHVINADPMTGLVQSMHEFGGTSAAASNVSADAEPESHCAHCKKKTMRRCSKCYRNEHNPVFYCSKECQQADLPNHKAVCSQQK